MVCFAQTPQEPKLVEAVIANNTLRIPRVSRPPKLNDFIAMKPAPEFANGGMLLVTDLKQRLPKDGAPVSQKTEVYLGYDQKNFYAAIIAFASDTSKIRAHLSKREDIWHDDVFMVMLDTFSDKRRAYGFGSNPLGVQAEGVWTEGKNWDFSWDTLWYTEGKLTPQGYVIVMSIPFKSMRFPNKPVQQWGIMLDRDIPGNDEEAFWPQYTTKVDGRLNQEGQAEGIEKVSPGRNMQFIPYFTAKSYRAPDLRDPYNPVFESKAFKGDAGLDGKIVLKDALVLDTTITPDFSQVESDNPQVTANRRFEVYYPELRPFFQENAGYFQTPIKLVFTRRIVNPTYGVRLTGKTGPYAIGILSSDDRSPGKTAPDNSEYSGTRSYYNIVRVNRDIWKQSTIGMLFTDREYQGSYNRVGGIDSRIKFDDHWIWTTQAVTSSTLNLDGTYSAGPSFYSNVQRNGRKFNYSGTYSDTSTGFLAASGFFRRPDYRSLSSWAQITWHPNGTIIYSHGPMLNTYSTFDHRTGTRLSEGASLIYDIQFRGLTTVEVGVSPAGETLRPYDFAALPRNQHYSEPSYWGFIGSNRFPKVNYNLQYQRSKQVNYTVPGAYDPYPGGSPPRIAWDDAVMATVTLRPLQQLLIDNQYTWERLRDPVAQQSVFNNHIARVKANYQISRALSVRFIETYQSLLTNPLQSTLQQTKGLNTDFLITYLLHPGTAFYVGYNSNMANLTPNLATNPEGTLMRTRDSFINDERLFFVKISYLFRF